MTQRNRRPGDSHRIHDRARKPQEQRDSDHAASTPEDSAPEAGGQQPAPRAAERHPTKQHSAAHEVPPQSARGAGHIPRPRAGGSQRTYGHGGLDPAAGRCGDPLAPAAGTSEPEPSEPAPSETGKSEPPALETETSDGASGAAARTAGASGPRIPAEATTGADDLLAAAFKDGPEKGTAAAPRTEPSGEHPLRVSLRGPAELADALPYLLGFHPDDSAVVVALHGERGRFGGRIRIGIPPEPEEWPSVAVQIASCLEGGSRSRGEQLEGALVFLCQAPAPGESGAEVNKRLRPLAQQLRIACGRRDMPVFEALCISGGRYFSYCCPDPRCCPPEGKPLAAPGTTALAAAAAYAGVQQPGTLKEMEARFAAVDSSAVPAQERALDAAGAALVPRMLSDDGIARVRAETLALAGRLLDRFRGSPPRTSVWSVADAEDDTLVEDSEAASAILGLQDRRTRDQAAEWMEGADVDPALRLWRALARRCVGPYAVHAAAPLTLAGWVAWSGGDGPAARVALGRALRTDPRYVFAQLLHHACNEGMDPEPLRRCMREERKARRAGGRRPRSATERRRSRCTGNDREGSSGPQRDSP